MNKIKIIFLMFFSITFSHSFLPYDFSLICPKDISVVIGKEYFFDLTIRNIGINDDFYNVTIQSPNNIRVSPSNIITNKIKSNESTSITFKLIPLSILGGDTLTIIVRSGNLPSKYSSCSFRIRLNYFSLGNFDYKKFFIVFLILLLIFL
jgi:hypothetical protein